MSSLFWHRIQTLLAFFHFPYRMSVDTPTYSKNYVFRRCWSRSTFLNAWFIKHNSYNTLTTSLSTSLDLKPITEESFLIVEQSDIQTVFLVSNSLENTPVFQIKCQSRNHSCITKVCRQSSNGTLKTIPSTECVWCLLTGSTLNIFERHPTFRKLVFR